MTLAAIPSATPEDHLRRFRATRDPEELGALFEATAPALLRVALATAPDAASAENAVQETFLAVLAAPERWDESRPVLPWLLGILRNQIGMIRRDGARAPDPLRVVPPLREDDPAANASSREEMARVRDAIDDLPEPYRQVAMLRWRHGLEPAEIAHLRGEPPGTTRSLLSRALAKLRERLGAFAFVWFGSGGVRGLDVVKRELVRRARECAATGSTGAAASAVVGGIVMKKLLVACALLVLLAIGGWGVVRWTSTSDADATRESAVAAAPAAAPHPRNRPPAAPEPTVDAPILPVDFAAVDPEREVCGLVVGPDGTPVKGAFLQVRAKPSQRLSGYLLADDESGDAARSAADGSFRLHLDPATPAEIVVRAAGFPEQIRSGCRAGQRITIRLAKGTPLVVEVVDDEGRPVPAATVYATRSLTYGDQLQSMNAATGADGTARFADVLAGYVAIRVAVSGVCGRFLDANRLRVPRSEPFRVALPPRVRIEGTVTDRASGEPIEGADVVQSWSNDPGATTDAKGRFALTLWQWKSWTQVLASKTGFGSAVSKVDRPGTLDFALVRSVPVKGRAVAEDGTPVVDARAAVVERPADSTTRVPASVAVDAAGRFVAASATPGAAHVLIVAAPGRQRVVVEIPASPVDGKSEFDVGDVVLARGRRISGTAVDADGRPCVGDKVTIGRPRAADAKPTTSDSLAWTSEGVLTDESGHFRFDALAPGEWNVWLNTADAPTIEPVTVALPPDRDVENVRLAMPGGRSLTVRVVDDVGAPVAEASIQMLGDFGQVGRVTHPLMGWTDGEGRARFRGLPAAPVGVSASVPLDRPYVRVGAAPSVVPDGQEFTVVLARATALRGKVLDEDGKPVAREYVDARIAGTFEDSGCARTADDGSFSIMVAAGQTVDLRLRGSREEPRADGAIASVPSNYYGSLAGLRGPLDGLVLRASKEPETLDRTLSVIVVDTSGLPVKDVELIASWGMKSVRATTSADGRALLEKLPLEPVHVSFWTGMVRARLAGLQTPPAPFHVAANGQEIRAQFRQGVELRGRVVDAAGKPVRASVSVRAPDYSYTSAQCDADGRFVAAALAGVAHHVEADVTTDGVRCTAQRAGAVPGSDEIELVVRPEPK